MATTAQTGNLISIPAVTGMSGAAPELTLASHRRRRMSREAGRAIEMLGHAIEYLADEFSVDCMSGRVKVTNGIPPQVTAIQMLMSLNREIYLNCPEIPTLGERMRSLLARRKTART